MLTNKKLLFLLSIIFMSTSREIYTTQSVQANSSPQESKVTIITKSNFDTEVLKAEKVVVLKFSAHWCGPCKMLTPIFEQLAQEVDDYSFATLDIDNERELTQQYKINAVPTIIIMQKGIEVARFSGFIEKADLLTKIKAALSGDQTKPIPGNLVNELIMAINQNQPDLVRNLIKQKADINYILKINLPFGVHAGKSIETSPLALALITGLTDIAQILLDAGASLDQTLLHHSGKTLSIPEYIEESYKEAHAMQEKVRKFIADTTIAKK